MSAPPPSWCPSSPALCVRLLLQDVPCSWHCVSSRAPWPNPGSPSELSWAVICWQASLLQTGNNSFSQLALWHQVPAPVTPGDFAFLTLRIHVLLLLLRALHPATWGAGPRITLWEVWEGAETSPLASGQILEQLFWADGICREGKGQRRKVPIMQMGDFFQMVLGVSGVH